MSNAVVSNTTPLISSAEVGLLDVLQTLYTTILIPPAVFRAYQAGIASHPRRQSLTIFFLDFHPTRAAGSHGACHP